MVHFQATNLSDLCASIFLMAILLFKYFAGPNQELCNHAFALNNSRGSAKHSNVMVA